MVHLTSLLFLPVLTVFLGFANAHNCLSDAEALAFSQKWLAIWGTDYITHKSQLRAIASSNVVSYDGSFGGPPSVGIDALFAAATYVDPLVDKVLQKVEWVFHSCDQVCARWSYDAVATGVAPS